MGPSGIPAFRLLRRARLDMSSSPYPSEIKESSIDATRLAIGSGMSSLAAVFSAIDRSFR